MTFTPLRGIGRRSRHPRRVVDTSIDWKAGLRPAQLESRRPDDADWQLVGGVAGLELTDESGLQRENDELTTELDATVTLLAQAERTIGEQLGRIAELEALVVTDLATYADEYNRLNDDLDNERAAKLQWQRSAAMFSDRNEYLRRKMDAIRQAVNGG